MKVSELDGSFSWNVKSKKKKKKKKKKKLWKFLNKKKIVLLIK